MRGWPPTGARGFGLAAAKRQVRGGAKPSPPASWANLFYHSAEAASFQGTPGGRVRRSGDIAVASRSGGGRFIEARSPSPPTRAPHTRHSAAAETARCRKLATPELPDAIAARTQAGTPHGDEEPAQKGNDMRVRGSAPCGRDDRTPGGTPPRPVVGPEGPANAVTQSPLVHNSGPLHGFGLCCTPRHSGSRTALALRKHRSLTTAVNHRRTPAHHICIGQFATGLRAREGNKNAGPGAVGLLLVCR